MRLHSRFTCGLHRALGSAASPSGSTTQGPGPRWRVYTASSLCPSDPAIQRSSPRETNPTFLPPRPPQASLLSASLASSRESYFFCTLKLAAACCWMVGEGVDLEAVESGNELVGRPLGPVLGVHHEQHVWEPRAEVRAVRVVVPGRLGGVDVHALGAVELDHGLARHVREADGHHGLVLAVDPGAVAEVPRLVLLDHLRDPPVRQDVSSVYEAVEHLGGLLDEVGLVGVILQLVVGLQVQDHVQRLSVVRHLLVQPRQVKLVLNIILVHFAEELIPAETAEPRDPGNLLRAGHLPLERRIDLVSATGVSSPHTRPALILL